MNHFKTKQGKFSDLTGMRFGRLTVIERAPDRIVPSGQHKVMWWCRCSCGNPNLTAVDAYSLTHHRTESCGCIHKETVSKQFSKPNQFDLTGEYGIGVTSKGERFYFDLDDYEKIKDITWYIGTGNVEGYVIGQKDKKTILMHRLVLNYSGPCDIDHIHGNDTRNDNRKCNLRVATRSQNNMNRNKSRGNTGVIGVHRIRHTEKYKAWITKDRKVINLGVFEKFEDAVDARKAAENLYFQEWGYDASQSDPEYFNPNERTDNHEEQTSRRDVSKTSVGEFN